MTPRTKEKFEEIRESKRRKIIDAAIECFATTGYHAVSISDLAAHAGVSKGLMYNYFTSKDDLLKTVFSEIMDQMFELFDPESKGIPEKKDLLKYLERYYNHLKSNLLLWKMYMAIFSQPAVQQILQQEILEASEKPLEILGNYFKKEGFEHPEVEVAFLSTLFSGVMIEYISDPDHYPLEQIRNRILRLYS